MSTKTATSDAFKYRAAIERQARKGALDEINTKNMLHNDSISPSFRPPTGKTLTVQKDALNRGMKINDPTEGMNFMSNNYHALHNRRENLFNDSILNTIKQEQANMPINTPNKSNLKSLGKGALIGAGLIGTGYGAKKLYDHYKTAEIMKKVAISPELKQRAFIERSARMAASSPEAQGLLRNSTGVNIRFGDSMMNKIMPGRANNMVQQAAPVRGVSPFNVENKERMMGQVPNFQEIASRAQQIRTNALTNKPITPQNSTLSNFIKNKPQTAPTSGGFSNMLKNPLTKKIGIGAGLLGAGALIGSKLSGGNQQPIQKMAFSSNLVNALELGGLGILAKPGIGTLRDPNASEHDKNHAKWETAGLGVLGIHPAYELGQSAVKGIRGIPSSMMSSVSPGMRQAGQKMHNIMTKIKFM